MANGATETYWTKRTIAVAAFATLSATSLALTPPRAIAQGPARVDNGGDLTVGGEAERYLRVLEVAGLAPARSWTIRPLVAPASRGFAISGAHPWAARWAARAMPPGFQRVWLRPAARLALNTTFPFEVIPGPAWAGRGLTAEFEGGVLATLGPLRAQVVPMVFVTQNASFPLAPNGRQGRAALRDARFPGNIDSPQRFGDGAYGRIEAGNTTLAAVLSHAVAGLSTAAQSWGPAREYPLILGPNSGGFAHAFLQTRAPLDAGFARIGARILGGTLRQSDWADATDPANRWASGLVFTILPRGLDGLELGMARFASGLSSSGIPGVRNVLRVLDPEFRVDVGGEPDENQVASAFFRWAVPRAGLEVYGEYMREDWAVQLRRLIQNPDDYATYVLGLQRARARSDGSVRAFRFEIVNGEVSSSNRRERGVPTPTGYEITGPIPPYVHSSVPQGHTNRGLILGSPEAYGGAAWRAGVDDYDRHGRTSLSIERRLRFDWLPGAASGTPPRPDVIYAVGAERMRFAGEREIAVRLIPMINLNRDLRPGRDVFNLSAALSVRGLR